MKKEAQRIAIAEACGWRAFYLASTVDFIMAKPGATWCDHERFIPGKPSPNARCSSVGEPPDYLGDLNAMFEAEQVLTHEQQARYYSSRSWERFGCGAHSIMHRNSKIMVSANAGQRAEVFLRTIGKWKEAEEEPEPALDRPLRLDSDRIEYEERRSREANEAP